MSNLFLYTIRKFTNNMTIKQQHEFNAKRETNRYQYIYNILKSTKKI